MDSASEYLQAVLLGLVQALTEFLPISSSGHLVLAPAVIGDDVSSLTFDVGLHLGTTAAVLTYFWRDWVEIVRDGLGDLARHRLEVRRWGPRSRLGLFIAVGTMPAVLVGLFFRDAIEANLREPAFVGAMLIVFALVIGYLDERGGKERVFNDVTAPVALVVGVAQAIALVPGVSRSGITIATARGLGFDRPSAARFSFLLSSPAIVGAAILTLSDTARSDEAVAWGPMLLGGLVAATVGWLVIRGLLAFLVTNTLRPFVWYRIALGLVVIGASLTDAL